MRCPRRRRGSLCSVWAPPRTAQQHPNIVEGGARAGPHRQGRRHRRRPQPQRLKTGNGNRWTRERVTSMRSSHRIPVYRPAEDGREPWLNLTQAASMAGVAPKTLRLAAERGEIEALHPLEDGTWLFRRSVSKAPPPASCLNAPAPVASTPQDQGSSKKASSHQQHSEMCVVMRRSTTLSDRIHRWAIAHQPPRSCSGRLRQLDQLRRPPQPWRQDPS